MTGEKPNPHYEVEHWYCPLTMRWSIDTDPFKVLHPKSWRWTTKPSLWGGALILTLPRCSMLSRNGEQSSYTHILGEKNVRRTESSADKKVFYSGPAALPPGQGWCEWVADERSVTDNDCTSGMTLCKHFLMVIISISILEINHGEICVIRWDEMCSFDVARKSCSWLENTSCG